MSEVGESFASHIDAWCEAHPALRAARLFLAERFTARPVALSWLQQALLELALGISETRVIEVKLAWWFEECALLQQGRARHPVVQALQGADDRESIAVALAQSLAATQRLIASESIGSVEELLAATDAVVAGLERLRCGPAAASAPLAVAAVALLDQARRWPRFAEPQRARIPLSVLARAQVDRVAAVQGAGAERALTALCEALLVHLPARPVPDEDPLNALRIQAGRRWAGAAVRRPRKALEGRLNPIGLPTILLAWRLGRSARVAR